MSTGTRQTVMLVREGLGLPPQNKPNNSSIISQLNLEVNTLWGELRITRDNEAFKRIEQQLDPTVSDYTVTRSDFGQAFMVESWDGGADPYYVPVEMTITPIQERDRQAIPYGQPSSTFVDPVFSFYTESGKQKFTITPALSTSAWVRIYYEVESYRLAFNDMAIPLRDSFVHLLVVRTALAKLSDTPLVGQKYQQKYVGLKEQEARLSLLFQDQRFMQQTENNARGSFGFERDDDGIAFFPI